jgi:hypothetical protein
MNHWHTVGLIAADHRADLNRDAEGNARLKVVDSAAGSSAGTNVPDPRRIRRWLVGLGAAIRARWVRRRAVSEA